MIKEFYDKYGKEFHCAECTFLDNCLKSNEPLYGRCCEKFLRDKIADLEAKLADKDKEIEEIKQIISKYTDKLPDNVAFDIANDDIRYQIVSNLIDKNTNYRNQIKELRQAKTDFAIEQLKQTKKLIKEKYTYDVEESDWAVVYELDIDEIFNQQINKLKEGK